MVLLQIKQYIPNKLPSRIHSLDKFYKFCANKKYISFLSQHLNANHYSASRQSLFHSLVFYEFHGDLLLSICDQTVKIVFLVQYYEMRPHSILLGVPFFQGIVFVQQKAHATLSSDLPSDKPSQIREIR